MASTVNSKKRRVFKYLSYDPGNPAADADNDTDSRTRDPPVKRKKVGKACIYCKRSHMTCDSERPCQRCIRRSIADLCCDEPSASSRSRASEEKMELPRNSDHLPATSPSTGSVSSSSDTPNLYTDHQIMDGRLPSSQSISFGEILPALYTPGPETVDSGSTPHLDTLHPRGSSTVQVSNHLSSQRVDNYYEQMQEDMESSGSQRLPSIQTRGSMVIQNNFEGLFPNSGGSSATQVYSMDDLLFGLHGLSGSDPLLESVQSMLLNQQSYGLPLSRTSIPRELLSTASLSNSQAESIGISSVGPSLTPSSLCPGFKNPLSSKIPYLRFHYANSNEPEVRPWNYTYSYAKMNRHMRAHWSEASISRITEAISSVRPRFLRRSQELSDIELVGQEKALISLVQHFEQKVFDLSPSPMLVWRRTGDIVAASSSFASLVGLPKSILGRTSTLCTNDLLSEESAVRIFEAYRDYCDEYEVCIKANSKHDPPPALHSDYTIDFSINEILRRAGYNKLGQTDVHGAVASARRTTVRCVTSLKPVIDDYNLPVIVVCTFVPIAEPTS